GTSIKWQHSYGPQESRSRFTRPIPPPAGLRACMTLREIRSNCGNLQSPALHTNFTCKPCGGSRRARCILPIEGTTSEMKPILLSAFLLSGMMLAVAQVKKEDLATKNTKSQGAESSVTIN